jgi:hypothetical protein
MCFLTGCAGGQEELPQADARGQQGKETPVWRHFYIRMIVYQDRLGTNIGKAALKKKITTGGRFLCVLQARLDMLSSRDDFETNLQVRVLF